MAHRYIIGQSGTGKSTLIKELILNDIAAGHAVMFIDPHGHDIDDLLPYIPRRRVKDTVLFDPLAAPVLSWNPLTETTDIPLTATALSDAIKDAWGYHGFTTPVMDMYLYFSIATLMDTGCTLFDSLKLFTDSDYRTQLTDTVTDTVLKDFWLWYSGLSQKEQREQASSTLNKLHVLFADPAIRQLLSQTNGRFRLTDFIKDKVLLVRLPQGQLGQSKTRLLGSILLALTHTLALSRSPDPPLSLYVDECHLFAPSTLAELLSGSRKFGVSLTVAHQYINQLDSQLFAALMGNATARSVFRVSPEDAVRFQQRLGRNAAHFDLDELRDFTYRPFPFDSRSGDRTVSPTNRKADPNTTHRIRTNTERNYSRPR